MLVKLIIRLKNTRRMENSLVSTKTQKHFKYIGNYLITWFWKKRESIRLGYGIGWWKYLRLEGKNQRKLNTQFVRLGYWFDWISYEIKCLPS